MMFTVVCWLLVATGAGLTLVSGCSSNDIRACGMDFVPFFNSTRLAEGEAALQEQCRTYLGQTSCAESYSTRCLQGLPRAVAVLGLEGAVTSYKDVCNKNSARHKVYIDNIACINQAGPRLHQCMNNALVIFQTAVKKAPQKRKIAYSCCYYHELKECFHDALVAKCNRPQVLEFFTKIMDEVFGDLLQLVCRQYKKNSPGCQSIPPLTLTRKDPSQSHNIVETLTDLVNSFG